MNVSGAIVSTVNFHAVVYDVSLPRLSFTFTRQQ